MQLIYDIRSGEMFDSSYRLHELYEVIDCVRMSKLEFSLYDIVMAGLLSFLKKYFPLRITMAVWGFFSMSKY